MVRVDRRVTAMAPRGHYAGPVHAVCSWGGGTRCRDRAVFWIYAPDGKPVPGSAVCAPHGRAIHDEYLIKLGEDWPLIPTTVTESHTHTPLSPWRCGCRRCTGCGLFYGCFEGHEPAWLTGAEIAARWPMPPGWKPED